MDHPVRLIVTDDLERSRLTVFFRLLLVIPHVIWLALWGFAAFFAWVVAWFAALFTKRVPQGLHDFLAGYVGYQVDVYAYMTLVADPYPPFSSSASYPVTVEIAPPAEQGRLGVFFRLLLALPALLISGVLNYLTELLAFSVRYHAQTQAYQFLLTDRYPSLNVGV